MNTIELLLHIKEYAGGVFMEKNESNLLETTAFYTKPARLEIRPKPRSEWNSTKQVRKGSSGMGYLLMRLGVCALVLCGVLAVKFSGDREALAVVGEMFTEEDDRSEEERLGRLKFVELPSIIDVFAPSKSPVLPTESIVFVTRNEGHELLISVEQGAEVFSPVEGRIRSVGDDNEKGRFIVVAAKDDVNYTVYGIDEVNVEEGQPVKQRQKLGSSAAETITVSADRSGRPLEILDVFGLKTDPNA